MASTYVNDLRLNEMATGDQSGSWGTVTNTNLELIAEAFSYGTEAITTNADTHTTTIADGATDPGRSMFLKYTGTLDSACTITIGPNTVSKLWFIENATSGSQNIIIKQGSGATVTIASGKTKVIYSDGVGSGAKMVDAFAALDVGSLSTTGDITFGDNDKAIFGAGSDLQIYHNGSHSFIKDVGEGNLYIDATSLYIRSADGEPYIVGTANAGVTLYHDNAAKLATTSTGIDVTGKATATDTSANAVTYALVTDNSGGSGTTIAGIGFANGGSLKSSITAAVYGNDYMTFNVGGSGTTERMRIDSSGRLLLGTSTSFADGNSENLQIAGSGNTGMMIKSGTANYGSIYFGDATSGDGRNAGIVRYFHNDNSMQFWTSEGERVRIDSNGNLLVGRTQTGDSTTGGMMRPDGFVQFTRDGGIAADFKRINSDGDIVRFQKDSNTVGTIGVASSAKMSIIGTNNNLQIGAAGSNIFNVSTASIYPDTDNSVDLGLSNRRFQDVYAVNYYGDGSNLTGVGGSTSWSEIGTYMLGQEDLGNVTENTTIAGSNLRPAGFFGNTSGLLNDNSTGCNITGGTSTQSGTWRRMFRSNNGGGDLHAGLYLRIS